MAFRIGEYVVRGELYNSKGYSTVGVLELRGCEQPISIQLTGHMGPNLRGKAISFEAREHPMMPFKSVDGERGLRKFGLHPMQIGTTGDMEIRRNRVAPCSVEQLLAMSKLGDPPPIEWRRCLYLEWFSQNGPVVIEMIDPILEFIEGEEEYVPIPDLDPQTGFPWGATKEDIEATMPEIEIVKLNPDGSAEVTRAQGAEAEELYPGELKDEDLNEALGLNAEDPFADDEDGIKETALYDNLHDAGRALPLASLFDEPMRLPREADIPDDQIEVVFKNLLAQLAMFNVAFHVCEHYTPRMAYKLLTEEILWTGESYRELRGSGWTQNFMTGEHCEECDRESEERFREFNKNYKPPSEGGEPDPDAPF